MNTLSAQKQKQREAARDSARAPVLKMPLAVMMMMMMMITGATARQDNNISILDKWETPVWNKFRDEVEEPGSWNLEKPLDQGLGPAKDPCLKIKCGRHKRCVTEDYKTPTCISQKSYKSLKCKRCPLAQPALVCATDRQTYSTKCQMEYQACISGTQIAVKCPGPCPCVSEVNKSGEKSAVYMTKTSVCKSALVWMFNRLDANFDLHLDHAELSGLGLGKDRECRKAFLRSCDLGQDQLISKKEWCSCFERHQDSPCQSVITNIYMQAGKKLRAPEGSGDLGSGDSKYDGFLNDQADMGDDEAYDDDDDDDDDDDVGYL